MADHVQGQPGADRAVGRPGPVARMSAPEVEPRPRPSVLIAPVTAGPGPAVAPPAPTAAPRPGGQSGATPPPQQVSGATAPPAGPAPAPSQASRMARTAVSPPPAGARSARLYVTHVDPWSVMKQAFLLALAIAVVILVATGTLWFALDSAGVIDAITRTATDVGGTGGASVGSLLGFGKVMGVALVLAAIETVLLTAMATLFAFLYNLSVGIGGGLEVTLSEED